MKKILFSLALLPTYLYPTHHVINDISHPLVKVQVVQPHDAHSQVQARLEAAAFRAIPDNHQKPNPAVPANTQPIAPSRNFYEQQPPYVLWGLTATVGLIWYMIHCLKNQEENTSSVTP